MSEQRVNSERKTKEDQEEKEELAAELPVRETGDSGDIVSSQVASF